VAVNDITKLKNNGTNQEEISNSDLKKKLLDTIETNQLLQALENTKKGDKSPIETMNELGFNFKDITGGLRENVELYKNLVEVETQKRSEIEQREHETKGHVIELKEKLLETSIMQQMEKYNQMLNEFIKKTEEAEKKKLEKKDDPMQNAVSDLTLKLLNDKIEDLTTQKQQNPMQEIFGALETYEELKSRFKPPETEIKTDANKVNLELVKLKLEDERERALEDKKIQIDREKQEIIKYALNTIGAELVDAAGAIAGALTQNTQNQPTQAPAQNQGVQGIPYQCEYCGQVFILHKVMDNAICPYCGKGEKGTEKTSE